jgi:hypothetical protein
MDLASELELTAVQDKLKEAAMSTIQTAKVALSQPDDILLNSQWQKTRKNATQAIQTFMFSSSKTNTFRYEISVILISKRFVYLILNLISKISFQITISKISFRI